jgi:nitrite reductase (NADH) large subunit
VIAQDRLVGAVLCGDNADANWYLELIRTGRPIGSLRDDLAFGRALADLAAA